MNADNAPRDSGGMMEYYGRSVDRVPSQQERTGGQAGDKTGKQERTTGSGQLRVSTHSSGRCCANPSNPRMSRCARSRWRSEDYIGTYTIPALELTVGGERVEFRPKGVLVIGAAGRVDIRGGRDTVTLVKNTDKAGGEWSMVLQRVPHLRTVPFDQESLKDALERVMLPLP